MHNNQTIVALYDTDDNIARIIPNCAEHGIERDKRITTIILSFFVSSILELNTAIVPQPTPNTIGRTALPFKPTSENNLLSITDNLGKYPESSNIPKKEKNAIMKKIINIFAVALVMTMGLISCVDEEGAGVPAPKSMFMQADEYTVDLTNDEVQSLTIRWIDVQNATYAVSLSNEENDVTEAITNSMTPGDLNTLSMTISYDQLAAYVEKAELNGTVGCDFKVNITGTPKDLSQPTALDAKGSTVSATIHYVE